MIPKGLTEEASDAAAPRKVSLKTVANTVLIAQRIQNNMTDHQQAKKMKKKLWTRITSSGDVIAPLGTFHPSSIFIAYWNLVSCVALGGHTTATPAQTCGRALLSSAGPRRRHRVLHGIHPVRRR
jgi:hypothetical protein